MKIPNILILLFIATSIAGNDQFRMILSMKLIKLNYSNQKADKNQQQKTKGSLQDLSARFIINEELYTSDGQLIQDLSHKIYVSEDDIPNYLSYDKFKDISGIRINLFRPFLSRQGEIKRKLVHTFSHTMESIFFGKAFIYPEAFEYKFETNNTKLRNPKTSIFKVYLSPNPFNTENAIIHLNCDVNVDEEIIAYEKRTGFKFETRTQTDERIRLAKLYNFYQFKSYKKIYYH